MSIRELTIAETSQVSGAGCANIGSTLTENEIFALRINCLLGVAGNYAQVDARYRGQDPRMVAAREPGLRKALVNMLDSFGLGGQETVNAWQNGNW